MSDGEVVWKDLFERNAADENAIVALDPLGTGRKLTVRYCKSLPAVDD